VEGQQIKVQRRAFLDRPFTDSGTSASGTGVASPFSIARFIIFAAFSIFAAKPSSCLFAIPLIRHVRGVSVSQITLRRLLFQYGSEALLEQGSEEQSESSAPARR
jgi:hypothetical protein